MFCRLGPVIGVVTDYSSEHLIQMPCFFIGGKHDLHGVVIQISFFSVEDAL